MHVITHPPHTAAIEGIMIIASIREVGECLVYLTSWLLLLSSGTSYSAAVWDGGKAPELCSEYRFAHIMWQQACSSSGNETWCWSGFKCSTDFNVPDIKLWIKIRLLKQNSGCNGSDVTPEVECLPTCIFFSPSNESKSKVWLLFTPVQLWCSRPCCLH